MSPLSDHECLNQLSEMLFGYRHAGHEDILAKVKELRNIKAAINAGDLIKGERLLEISARLTDLISEEEP